MSYIVGIVLAAVICIPALRLSPAKRRWFFPLMVIVIVVFDVVFAWTAHDQQALLLEAAILLAYIAVALLSYRFSLWLSVAALAAHGIFDLSHEALFTNHGIPAWWPAFCMSYDVVAAIILGAMLVSAITARHARSLNTGRST